MQHDSGRQQHDCEAHPQHDSYRRVQRWPQSLALRQRHRRHHHHHHHHHHYHHHHHQRSAADHHHHHHHHYSGRPAAVCRGLASTAYHHRFRSRFDSSHFSWRPRAASAEHRISSPVYPNDGFASCFWRVHHTARGLCAGCRRDHAVSSFSWLPSQTHQPYRSRRTAQNV